MKRRKLSSAARDIVQLRGKVERPHVGLCPEHLLAARIEEHESRGVADREIARLGIGARFFSIGSRARNRLAEREARHVEAIQLRPHLEAAEAFLVQFVAARAIARSNSTARGFAPGLRASA